MDGRREIIGSRISKDDRLDGMNEVRSSNQPQTACRTRPDDSGRQNYQSATASSDEEVEGDNGDDVRNDSAVNTMEIELVEVEQLLLVRMQSLKRRLREVKRDDHRQRVGSLDRVERSKSTPRSVIDQGTAATDTAATADKNTPVLTENCPKVKTRPATMLVGTPPQWADISAGETGQLDARRQDEEVRLRLHVDRLKNKLDVQKKIVAATRLRRLTSSGAHRPSGTSFRLAAEVDNTTALNYQNGKEHQKTLNRIAADFATRLDTKSVAHVMVDHGALSLDELDIITRCRNESEAAGVLLGVVLNEVEPAVYDCFLDSLRATDHHEMYSLLVYSDSDSLSKSATIINMQDVDDNFLLHNMDSRDSGLTYELFSAGLIDTQLKKELDSEMNQLRRNEKIVSLVKTFWTAANAAERFIRALDRSGQRHIADALRGASGVGSTVFDAIPGGVVQQPDDIRSLPAVATWRSEPTSDRDAFDGQTEQHTKPSLVEDDRHVIVEQNRPIDSPLHRHKDSRLELPNAAIVHTQLKSTGQVPMVDRSPVCVSGIAHLDNRIFLIVDGYNRIKVMRDEPPYVQLDDILADGLGRPTDVVACSVTRFLFVADYHYKSIWRVSVDSDDDDDDDDSRSTSGSARSWVRTEYRPWSMSTSAGRLVVTPVGGSFLYVYRCDGHENTSGPPLIRSVRLPSYMIPRHAVERDAEHNTFIVSHTGRGLWTMHDQISEVDIEGHVIRFYGGRRGSDKRRLDRPSYLVALGSAVGGGILVADYFNRRVVRLDDRLEFDEVIVGKDIERVSYDGDGSRRGSHEGKGVGKEHRPTADDDFMPSRLCFMPLSGALLVSSWGLGIHVCGPVLRTSD